MEKNNTAVAGHDQEKPAQRAEGPSEEKRSQVGEQEVRKSRTKIIVLLGIAGLLLVAGATVLALFLAGVLRFPGEAQPEDDEEVAAEMPEEEEPEEVVQPEYYSVLTGLPIASEALNKLPTFCVQIPNGTDGARPQAGLDKAGVIFEAIAERGITRFAAIYQNVKDIAVIGPMRSLRMYYLQWDLPFDCTIVHDGGADDALAAVRGHKDFTAFGGFVWRSTKTSALNRRWNNEFTSGDLLLKYNAKRGYGDSNVKGFSRLTPKEALVQQVDATAANKLDIDSETDTSTMETAPKVTRINLTYGNMANYNPVYTYDAQTNTYKRSYASGAIHKNYNCDGQSGKVTPEKVCKETQLAPSVVIAMIVQEKLAADKYHESITTIGSGKAYIFQSGIAIEATWKKPSANEQIKFYNAAGEEIKLAPGQTMISAVPNYGKVEYK